MGRSEMYIRYGESIEMTNTIPYLTLYLRSKSPCLVRIFPRSQGDGDKITDCLSNAPSFHVSLGHETEAGLTLKLWADLHTFDTTKIVVAVPDLNLPRQTEFARKELVPGALVLG